MIADATLLLHEEWRAVVGFEGWYEVSSFGNVRRIKGGPGARLKPLSISANTHGYSQVSFCVQGREFKKKVHILVAEAFLGPRPAGQQVNHLDGHKPNCHVSNLEYTTPSGNALHAFASGLRTPRTKILLSAKRVRLIREMRTAGAVLAKIAETVSVSVSAVRDVLNGRTWGHV